MVVHKERNEIDFSNGNIILNKAIKLCLTRLNLYLYFLKELNNQIKDNPKKIQILRELIKEDANILINSINNKNKIKKLISCLELFNTFGFGEIDCQKMYSKEIIICEEGQQLPNAYYSLFQKRPEIPLEEITSGFLEEIITTIYEKKINVKSNLKGNKIFWKILISNKDEIVSNYSQANKYKFSNNKNYKQSIILKKVILNNHIKINNGKISLWGARATFLPIIFVSNIFSKIDINNPNFIEDCGIILGKASVELQKKVFGKKEKLFEDVVMQTELDGNGVAKYQLNDDLSKIKFEYENRNISNHTTFELYKKYTNKIIQGIYEESFEIKTNYLIKKNGIILTKNSNSARKLNRQQQEILKAIKTQAIIFSPKNK